MARVHRRHLASSALSVPMGHCVEGRRTDRRGSPYCRSRGATRSRAWTWRLGATGSTSSGRGAPTGETARPAAAPGSSRGRRAQETSSPRSSRRSGRRPACAGGQTAAPTVCSQPGSGCAKAPLLPKDDPERLVGAQRGSLGRGGVGEGALEVGKESGERAEGTRAGELGERESGLCGSRGHFSAERRGHFSADLAGRLQPDLHRCVNADGVVESEQADRLPEGMRLTVDFDAQLGLRRAALSRRPSAASALLLYRSRSTRAPWDFGPTSRNKAPVRPALVPRWQSWQVQRADPRPDPTRIRLGSQVNPAPEPESEPSRPPACRSHLTVQEGDLGAQVAEPAEASALRPTTTARMTSGPWRLPPSPARCPCGDGADP